jgi:hypothetical protein
LVQFVAMPRRRQVIGILGIGVIILIGIIDSWSRYTPLCVTIKYRGQLWEIGTSAGRVLLDNKPQRLFEASEHQAAYRRFAAAMEDPSSRPSIAEFSEIMRRAHTREERAAAEAQIQRLYPQRPQLLRLTPLNRHDVAFAWIWLLAVFGIVPPIASRVRQQTRLARGLCPQCGYDLRASPNRCPECGTCFDAARFKPAEKRSCQECGTPAAGGAR